LFSFLCKFDVNKIREIFPYPKSFASSRDKVFFVFDVERQKVKLPACRPFRGHAFVAELLHG